MGKASVHFYELDVTESDIEEGFLVGAFSPYGSKFKLLLFERTSEDSPWELFLQVRPSVGPWSRGDCLYRDCCCTRACMCGEVGIVSGMRMFRDRPFPHLGGKEGLTQHR